MMVCMDEHRGVYKSVNEEVCLSKSVKGGGGMGRRLRDYLFSVILLKISKQLRTKK